MAYLYCPRFVALDANGRVISGARLYTFDSVSTTTPKETFSNNTLTTSNGPYVTADASGVFPPIYAASGAAFYAVLKTAAGVMVDEFPFIAALGADDASILSLNFGANGRMQLRGSGGLANLEAGDPTGDDLGGDLRVGGWAGTQLDTLELDAAAASTTGDFAAGGDFSVSGASPFLTVADHGSVSGVASLNISLPTAFTAWRLDLSYLNPAGGCTAIDALFAFDGVPNFKTGADDYGWAIQNTGPTAGTGSGSAIDSSDARIGLIALGTPTANSPGHGSFLILSDSGKETGITGEFFTQEDGVYGFYQGRMAGQTRAKNYGKATHLQLKTSTGTFSAKWVLTGIPYL